MSFNKPKQVFIFFIIDFLFNFNINADNECELGWTYFNLTHGCYKVLSNLNFELAQEECSLQKSGSLVSIHNHEENEFVNNLVEKSIKWDFNSNILLTAWIGLHDLTFNKKWRWPDDSMVDYTNWNIGEPNGEFGRESCVETIVRLDKPNPRNPIMSHSWNDIPCSVIRPAAVCKYKHKLHYLIIIIIPILIVIIIYIKVRQRRQFCCRYRMLFNRTTKPDIEYHSNTCMMLIKKEQLIKKKKIDEGSFGTVYAGNLLIRSPNVSKFPVAIKVMKYENKNLSIEKDLIDEASIMAQLKHEYLLPLIGVCIAGGLKIVTPLRPLGSLKKFLQTEKNKLDVGDLVSYCFQIASGMEYLSNKKIVHRDLAARNVLMKESNHVQVTDFGLAKMVSNDIPDSEKKIPVRWTAIECLTKTSEFSEASDVWSFGITCWEIITFGQMQPYSNCKLAEKPTYIESLAEYLIQGGRLISKSGEICTLELYIILIQCWAENPITRPKFVDLREFFDRYRAEPAKLILKAQQNNSLDKSKDSDQRQLNLVKGIWDGDRGTLGTDKGTLDEGKGIFDNDNTNDQVEKFLSQGVRFREKNDSKKSSSSESSEASNIHDIQVEIHSFSSDEEEDESSDEEKT